MNFIEAAYLVVSHHPVASIAGAAVSAVVLWKGAKTAFNAIKADVEHHRENERRVANLPRPSHWVPPEKRPRP
jgi:hypothetical protein